MRISEFVLLAIGVAVALPASWGYSMVSLSKPNFLAAKLCFWASAALFGSLGIVWATANPNYPMATRLIAAGITGAVAAVTLAWALSQLIDEPKSAKNHHPDAAHLTEPQKGTVSQGTGQAAHTITNTGPVYNAPVTLTAPPEHKSKLHHKHTAEEPMTNSSPNINTGIIIQGDNTGNPTVNNFGPPPPILRYLGTQPPQKAADGTFTFTWTVEVVGKTPANYLTCITKVDGNILGVGIASPMGTMFSSWKDAAGAFHASLQNARGEYYVQVHTSVDTPIPSVTCQIE